MNVKASSFDPSRWIACLVFLLLFSGVKAQDSNQILLDDLNSFDAPPANWQEAGGVTVSLEQDNAISIEEGEGILVNNPESTDQAQDLYSKLSHGDMDLSLDFMMAKGSNSGIYLQGRYEIQLHDSWTVKVPSSSHNGGVYQRPANVQGNRQGYAPRQNASRAPGLWQHMEISFQAPRFNEQGQKVANARILSVELNGVVIHENIELLGPTAGAMSEDEVPKGPLRFQGDHGPVAFRNITITQYPDTPPELVDLEYNIYEGEFEERPDLDTLKAIKSGQSDLLTPYLGSLPGQFLMHYTGTMQIPEAASYQFELNVSGGAGVLQVADEELIGIEENEGTVELQQGEVPFNLFYVRQSDWNAPYFELAVSSEGLRRHVLSDQQIIVQSDRHPIYVNAQEKPLLRSFRDLPNGDRLTHAMSVSSLQNIHFTYDMNRGNLVQVWRGEFLDATPMWYNRGDGSSRPSGSVENLLSEPALLLNRLENEQAAWKNDTTDISYRSRGYKLDDSQNPTFRYEVFGVSVEDRLRTVRNGRGFRRTLNINETADDLYLRLARGNSIEEVAPNRYAIDDRSYYIEFDDSLNIEPIIRTIDGSQEMILAVQPTVNYTILF
ncbi:MAG: DUF1080 domain-containing protein [Balneolaceae bacterium]|nr:DUF1080 domain-containing protein [Balneolaceae bacterium]